MTMNELQRAALVLFAAREAGSKGSLDEMKAICHIVRNRLAAGWGENLLELIERAPHHAGNDPLPGMLDLNDRRLQMLAQAVDEIYHGQAEDEVARVCGRQDKEHGPLLYWMFIDREPTTWFRCAVVCNPETHRQRAQFGLMYCYE